jgi:hypothetical protein
MYEKLIKITQKKINNKLIWGKLDDQTKLDRADQTALTVIMVALDQTSSLKGKLKFLILCYIYFDMTAVFLCM